MMYPNRGDDPSPDPRGVSEDAEKRPGGIAALGALIKRTLCARRAPKGGAPTPEPADLAEEVGMQLDELDPLPQEKGERLQPKADE